MTTDSMRGRVCLITGATSGVGQATALGLASRGAGLVLVCRNPERGRATVERIQEHAPGTEIELLQADLSVQAEVRKLARDVESLGRPLHVLVNNAGVVHTRFRETVDGIETTFAVNHLSYFMLTLLLLESLRANAPARIVNVASDVYRYGRLHFEDLDHRRRYRGMAAYAQSKLANVLFTLELASRLDGTGVTVNCVHPGFVRSGLGMQNGRILPAVMRLATRPFARTPEQGAETPLHLASAPELGSVTGRYFVRRRPVELRRVWGDPYAGKRLWDASAELTGIGG